MNRFPFDTPDTVAFALLLIVADQRADHTERIVLKEHLPCLIGLSVQKELNHIGDGRMDGASLTAHRLFAIETAPGFVYNMNCQEKRSFPLVDSDNGNVYILLQRESLTALICRR